MSGEDKSRGGEAIVKVRRDGRRIYLSFPYRPWLVEWVREFPFAQFNKPESVWTAMWSSQAYQLLAHAQQKGFLDGDVESLTTPDEKLVKAPRALVWARSETGELTVRQRGYDETLWRAMQAISGGRWQRQFWVFPPGAIVALRGMVRSGVLEDPGNYLSVHEPTVVFSPDFGEFTVLGEDPRADDAFQRYFPARDVVAQWREKGLKVSFADALTEEVYRGEVARHGDIPDRGLREPLFEYQRRNVAVALERSGFVIVDEPGLGKTPQAIAVGTTLLGRGEVSRVVVIAPASSRTQWQQEICRFTGEDADEVVVIDGDTKGRQAAYTNALTRRWMVVHYDILARDLESLRPVFEGALVVADEAHRLKNHDSARAKAACELAAGSKRRLALTGTPLETDVMEWFSLLGRFTLPGIFGGAQGYKGRYQLSDAHGACVGTQNLSELRDRSKWHLGRHTKAQVAAHLPPLRVQRVVLDVSLNYRKALKVAHKEAAEAIREHAPSFTFKPGVQSPQQDLFGGRYPASDISDAQAVMQLRRLCASPRLVTNSGSASAGALLKEGLVPHEDGPKLDALRELAQTFLARRRERLENQVPGQEVKAEDVQDERFVVFTHSRDMAELISARLEGDGVPTVLFTGGQSSGQREEARDSFTDPGSEVVAFVATDAAAEALNLGRCCSTLVQFDPPWIPGLAQQRMNRIHRVDGTARNYLVVNLMLANTLEEGMYRLLGSRADLQDTLLGEEGTKEQVVGARTSPRDLFAGSGSARAS